MWDKASTATADIPVIFMTALSDTTSKVKGLSLGAVDYITKDRELNNLHKFVGRPSHKNHQIVSYLILIPKPFEQDEAIARVRLHLQLRHLTQTLEEQVQEGTIRLSRTLEELQDSQLQIIQSEKMSVLGNLVAGVAHEINNPVGCIIGNVMAVQDSIDLFCLESSNSTVKDCHSLMLRWRLNYKRSTLTICAQISPN